MCKTVIIPTIGMTFLLLVGCGVEINDTPPEIIDEQEDKIIVMLDNTYDDSVYRGEEYEIDDLVYRGEEVKIELL